MKGLVLAEGDLLRRHGGGKPLVFLCAEADQQRLHFGGHGLLRAVGRGDKGIQTTQLQKPPQVAQPAITGLTEHQMGGGEDPVEKVQARGGFQKPGRRCRPGTVLDQLPLALDPVV